MDFKAYQQWASQTALYLDKVIKQFPDLPEEIKKVLGLAYCGLGMGESGEVQGKIKKMIRDAGGEITPEFTEKLIGELGDCLWYVAALCTELGVSMEDVAKKNIEKLLSRKERNVIRGSGDNR